MNANEKDEIKGRSCEKTTTKFMELLNRCFMFSLLFDIHICRRRRRCRHYYCYIRLNVKNAIYVYCIREQEEA
jgi:hypothetical protein